MNAGVRYSETQTDIAGSTLLYLPCSSFGSYGRLGPRRL
jgi:hypothetical protein